MRIDKNIGAIFAVLTLCIGQGWTQPRGTTEPRQPSSGGPAKGESPFNKTDGTGASPANETTPAAAGAVKEDSLYGCGKAKGKFKVNLKPDTSLNDLVSWAFSFTCKNFIYGNEVSAAGQSAKVTIVAPEAMTAQQAWRMFLIALRSMKLTVVPRGNLLEIVPEAMAKDKPLPIYGKSIPGGDQIIRAVFRPQHISVEDLKMVFDGIRSKTATQGADGMLSIPKAGMLMVTDYGSNIAQMTNILAEVDQPIGSERLYFIRVKSADAKAIAETLQEIMELQNSPAGAGANSNTGLPAPGRKQAAAPRQEDVGDIGGLEVEAAKPSKIVVDERSNSLILLATEPAFRRTKALVGRLDASLDVEGRGEIHVYRLENANAEETQQTLNGILTGSTGSAPAAGGGGGGRGGVQGGNARPAGGGAAVSDGVVFEGPVRVTADKPTNSLVIVSSLRDYRSLRDVIRELDVPRKQVYMEVSIVEVSVGNGRNLGTTFHGGVPFGDGNIVVGGAQHKELSSLNVETLITASGLIGGAIGAPLEGAEAVLKGTTIPSFGVLFQALATASNLNLLSAPHIITKDNEEAEISVGSSVPYLGALTALPGATGTGIPTQSISRQDVSLTLKVTPHVGDLDVVNLDIDLDIQDITDPNFQGLGPVWSKRKLKNKVVVPDQHYIVLGGIIQEKETSTENKVPLLGDIPVLGYLFKYATKSKEKRNLLVVLTPYVARDHKDLERIVNRRRREQDEFVEAMGGLSSRRYDAELDYRRKRGLLAQIDHVVMKLEQDADEQRLLEEQMIFGPDGPLEYEDVPNSKPNVTSEDDNPADVTMEADEIGKDREKKDEASKP